MREIQVREDDFESVEQLHDYLYRELGFPAHYGNNFAALSDCLEDISRPTRIVVYRRSSAGGSSRASNGSHVGHLFGHPTNSRNVDCAVQSIADGAGITPQCGTEYAAGCIAQPDGTAGCAARTDGTKPWFDKACAVMKRVALENDALNVMVEAAH